MIALLLFDIIQLHLSSPNDIPMSWLNVPVKFISESTSRCVVHVEAMANGRSSSQPIFIATLCDDLAEGVQAYAEQQGGQNLCSWLGIGVQGCLPQSQ